MTAVAYQTDVAVDGYDGQIGWVQVHLWTCSIVTTAIEAGAGNSAVTLAPIERRGGVPITGATRYPTYPPERVLRIGVFVGSNYTAVDDGDAGQYYQICGWSSSAAVEYAWTVPVVGYGTTTAALQSWAIHTLGVIELSGWLIEATPAAAAVPGAAAYNIAEPCTEIVHIGLVGAIAHLVDNRLPTWSPRPGQTIETSGQRCEGLLRWSGGTYTEITAVAAKTIATCPVSHQSPDKNGHRVIVCVALYHDHPGSYYQQPVKYLLRAVGMNAAAAEQAASAYSTITIPMTWMQNEWLPPTIARDIWGSMDVSSRWQLRGALHGQGEGHGLDQYTTFELELDETGITYPCVLEVRAIYPATAASATTHYTVGAGFAARSLE